METATAGNKVDRPDTVQPWRSRNDIVTIGGTNRTVSSDRSRRIPPRPQIRSNLVKSGAKTRRTPTAAEASVSWMQRHVAKKSAVRHRPDRALKLEELIQYQLLSSKLAAVLKQPQCHRLLIVQNTAKFVRPNRDPSGNADFSAATAHHFEATSGDARGFGAPPQDPREDLYREPVCGR